MRARAQELGLADADVARRLGIAQPRYANYIAEIRQPDFGMFLKICNVLNTTPNVLLGVDRSAPLATEADRLRQRIAAGISSIADDKLLTLLAVVEAMVGERSEIKE